jgi:ATP-dependent RNA helicase DeaD
VSHSFEDLEVEPELVEALAAEGLEEPTEFQRAAVPVMRRGNNLLGAVGPGAGTLVAYGVALLERIEPRAGRPGAVVLTATTEAATALAESLGRIALATGHTVGALGGTWALAERADVLFGTARDVRAAVDGSQLTLEGVQSVVVDGASAIEAASGLESVGALFEYLATGIQRIVLSLPITESVEALVSAHVPKAVQVPPRPISDEPVAKSPARGELRFRITPEDKVEGLLSLVAELFADDARHVLVFCRSEDRVADVGDFLALHGYMAGAPGDESLPLWLSVAPLEAREALANLPNVEGIRIVSLDCPPDVDTLDRRHGGGGEGTVVLVSREVPHFRDTARRAGYGVRPLPPPPSVVEDRIGEIRKRLVDAAKREDLAPHFLILEPLLERFSAQELAAAALALLSKPTAAAAESHPAAKARAEQATGTDGWTRLFVSIGEMEGMSPGSLLGTLAGESGVDGSHFGKIEIRETFSLVEVRPSEAEKVIKAVNGLSIRGRSTRVDYDRGAGSKGSKPVNRGGARSRSRGSDDSRS